MQRLRGFTLIELLVVIAIIGILASMVLVSLNGARGKSRNTRLISDANQIRILLESQSSILGTYPGNNVVVAGGPESLVAAPWTAAPYATLLSDITAQSGNAALKVYEVGANRSYAVYVIFTDLGGYCTDSVGGNKTFTAGTTFSAGSSFSACASATAL